MALGNMSSTSNSSSTSSGGNINGAYESVDSSGAPGHYYEDQTYSNGYRGYRGRGRYRDNTSYRGRGSGARGGSDGYYRGYYGERRGGYSGGRYGSGYYGGREGSTRGGYTGYDTNRESYTPPDHRSVGIGGDSSPEITNDSTSVENIGDVEDTKRPGSAGHHGSGSFRGHRGGYRGRGSFHGSSGYHYDANYSTNETKASTPRHYKDTIVNDKLKSFNNPWINILGIQDQPTQTKLESRFNELSKVDKEIQNLQKAKLKLESSVSSLDKQAIREELHVQLTSEKLEEFTYL